MELHSEAEADAVIQAVSGQPFTVSKVKRQDKLRNPAPPLPPPPSSRRPPAS